MDVFNVTKDLAAKSRVRSRVQTHLNQYHAAVVVVPDVFGPGALHLVSHSGEPRTSIKDDQL